MSTTEQHFVPRVYLKAWETQVETLTTPDIKFKGVYTFKEANTLGNGANRKSILWKPHLYTITFDHSYIMKSCPEIFSDFIDQIYKIMQNGFKKPLYAKLGYSKICTKQSIRKHFRDIDKWDFYYNDGNLAPQSVKQQIGKIKSFIIEDGLNKLYENHWLSILESFINEMNVALPIAFDRSERVIRYDTAIDMLSFFFIMLCRNPNFNAMGVYTKIKNNFLYPMIDSLFHEIDQNNPDTSTEKEPFSLADGYKYMDDLMTGVWYSELYRAMFKKSKGAFHTMIRYALEGCQMVLFESKSSSTPFITSDNPAFEYKCNVVVDNMNGFIFPLSPNYLLFIAKGSEKINIVDYRYADYDTVKKFNSIIQQNKTEIVISNKKQLR